MVELLVFLVGLVLRGWLNDQNKGVVQSAGVQGAQGYPRRVGYLEGKALN